MSYIIWIDAVFKFSFSFCTLFKIKSLLLTVNSPLLGVINEPLTLLHSERPKLYTILTFLSDL